MSVLYVKEILATKCEVCCRCLSLAENNVYYGLKSSIFIEVDDLLTTGRSACCKQKYSLFNIYKNDGFSSIQFAQDMRQMEKANRNNILQ
jgi:hypothetical protein